MGLILRVDVDKPYGRKNLFEKLKSKAREDFWFPQINSLGYLSALQELLVFCNKNNVKGAFYHRNCTIPNEEITHLLKEGNHLVGFHAENTKNFSTFQNELNKFKAKINNLNISSFTKHGSGDIKIGKHHYPPYEPEKYKKWSKDLDISYLYGNEICDSEMDFKSVENFHPKMFWVHREYRNSKFSSLETVINLAKTCNIPIILHPSNFIANPEVNQDFKKLVALAKDHSVSWI